MEKGKLKTKAQLEWDVQVAQRQMREALEWLDAGAPGRASEVLKSALRARTAEVTLALAGNGPKPF